MTTHRFAVIHYDGTLDLPTLSDKLSHLEDADLPSNAMHRATHTLSYSENTHIYTLKITITDTRATDPWLITLRLHPSLNKWFTVQPFESQTYLTIDCTFEISVFCYYPRDNAHHIDDPSADSIGIIKAMACALSKQSDTPLILEIPNRNLIVYTKGDHIKAFEQMNLSR